MVTDKTYYWQGMLSRSASSDSQRHKLNNGQQVMTEESVSSVHDKAWGVISVLSGVGASTSGAKNQVVFRQCFKDTKATSQAEDVE